ncbi:hypothetical protein [Pseudofrankia asymbiotica]|uniref:Uncharacterized protein n=1 Tax=Pseudofrankia asymbiotica TaxID=1834516 RepID=A0A1V2ID60_9ACTN|nr:hypothetical protein [Pseudofrankia asymbiotica]ONH31122.1 hypothetical protein BL253_10730 [Pseudofrankia asymbiotica]
MTGYPSAEDYIKAVQRPDLVFDRPELTGARFDVHPMLGIPVPASGSTAVVFRATVGGTAQALRFFTREDASTQQRYTALNAWFTERGLTDDVASCRWVNDAILVNGRRWPMVQMEWVDGHPLDQHVEDLVQTGDRVALGKLAYSWRDLLRRTQGAQFAHGDLQHGNVLVDTDSRLRLVDFDSSWIVPFTGFPPPSEGGHRNYQPENRVWGPWMDTFPGLVIYLSLLALARDPKQWEQLNDGENLLFGHQDYLPPHRTEAWSWVERLHDPEVDQLAARLRACCAPSWTATGDLEELIAAPVPWWTRTVTHPSVGPAAGTPVGAPVGTPPAPGPGSTTAPPWPRRQPDPQPAGRPGPQPTGPSGWWQQQPGPRTGPAQPAPTQPTAPPPAAARPIPSRPAPARAGGMGGPARTAGLYLAAMVAATVVWAVALALIAVLLHLAGLPPAAGSIIAALVALVPALMVFRRVVRRRRRRPPGKTP